ncbi:MAG: hypothetical protein PHS37_05345 [Candidatus Omnitrophica bacterium]|nr:hypothetical protein [Candidatus Omnitrophota bacterium]
MFARMTTVFVNVAKLDEMAHFFKETIILSAKQQRGFKKAVYLTEPHSGKIVILTIWEDEESALESESTGYYYTTLSKMTPFFDTQPVREVFQVNVSM